MVDFLEKARTSSTLVFYFKVSLCNVSVLFAESDI